MAKTAAEILSALLSRFSGLTGKTVSASPDNAVYPLFLLFSEQLAEAYSQSSLIPSGVSLENDIIPEVLNAKATLLNYEIPKGRVSRLTVDITSGSNTVYINKNAKLQTNTSGIIEYFYALESYTIEPTTTKECTFVHALRKDIYIPDTATLSLTSGFTGTVSTLEYNSINIGVNPPSVEQISTSLSNLTSLNTAVSAEAICELIKNVNDLTLFTCVDNKTDTTVSLGDIDVDPYHVAFIAYPAAIDEDTQNRIVTMLNYLMPIGVKTSNPLNSSQGFLFSDFGEIGLKRDIGVFYANEIGVSVRISVTSYGKKANGTYYTESEVTTSVRQTLVEYADEINTNRDPVFRPIRAAAKLMQQQGISECTVQINTGSGFVSTNYTKSPVEFVVISSVTFV